MSDNFEFDDNDDVLLGAFPTQPSVSVKATGQERLVLPKSTQNHIDGDINDENSLIKKRRLGGDVPPIEKGLGSLGQGSPFRNSSVLNTAKRIFPGPAGILSEENQTEICSQDTNSFFQDGPWKEMSKDFLIRTSLHLYDKFNIGWIKKQAIANRFVNRKAPFLACTLLSMEVSEGHKQKTVNVTLKDMTGTIQGTILQNLYDEYASHLTLGAVLVINNFGVLTCTCDKCDNHHITITPKNLSAIYSKKEKKIIQKIIPEDILQEYSQREKEHEFEGTLKNLQRQNENRLNFQNNISCTSLKGSVQGPQFLNSGPSKKLAANNFNKTAPNSDNCLRSNESFAMPKIKAFNESGNTEPKSLKQTETVSTSTKRLFNFRKINTPPDSINCDNLSSISPLKTCSNNLFISGGGLNIPKPVIDTIDSNFRGYLEHQSSKTISNRSLTIKEEHDKILKDILEDVDINSLFNDEF